jgi:polyisoprenoid-binding protein YceI
MRLPLIFAAALLAGTASVEAAPVQYQLDPAHTSVIFVVNHLGFSNVYGRFTDVSGTLGFDEGAVESSTISAVIKTNSLDTAFAKREEHLKSPDFFNVASFPEMRFTSTHIEKTGAHTGKVTGTLSLLGVTKPLTLEVTFNKSGIGPISKKETAGFSAHASLKRSDFGMTTFLPAIGDSVDIRIETEAVK